VVTKNQEPRTKNGHPQGQPRTRDRHTVLGSRFSILPLRLALLGIGAALLYAAALAYFPLLTIYAQPIQNLDKLTRSDGRVGLALASGVLLLFVGYCAGALALIRSHETVGKAGGRRWALALVVIGFPLIFLALLVLVYPTTSVDLYDYIFRGRMLARYHANTFVQVPSEFQKDPLFWFVAWRQAVTAYGPLWEGLSWLTATIAGEVPGRPGAGPMPGRFNVAIARDAELLRLMLAYKGLGALGFLLCGGAIWAILRRTAPQHRWLGLYLWLWNPLALWESLAAGHNDAWMAALIVLAVGLFQRRDTDKATGQQGDNVTQLPSDPFTLSPRHLVTPSVAAFLALTLGGLIKFLALFFGPILLSAALRRLPTWRERLRLVTLGGLACAVAVAVAYAPFWVGWGTLRNFRDRGTLFTSSWLAVLQAPISLSGVRAIVPTHTLLALVAPEDRSQRIAVSLGLGLLAFGVLWATWRAWSAPERVAKHALWLLLWFLFLCNPWFQPWYLLWALALLALQPWRRQMAWCVGLFCCTAMLSYLAGVFLLPLLGWDADSAEWNALTAALIYLPPLLAFAWGGRIRLAALWQRLQRLPHAVIARQGRSPSPADRV
jgi:hypothetical protein